MRSNEGKWNQMKSCEIKWKQTSARETSWIQERPPAPTNLLSNFSWPYRYIYIYIMYIFIVLIYSAGGCLRQISALYLKPSSPGRPQALLHSTSYCSTGRQYCFPHLREPKTCGFAYPRAMPSFFPWNQPGKFCFVSGRCDCFCRPKQRITASRSSVPWNLVSVFLLEHHCEHVYEIGCIGFCTSPPTLPPASPQIEINRSISYISAIPRMPPPLPHTHTHPNIYWYIPRPQYL